jgi:hypothetical protein
MWSLLSRKIQLTIVLAAAFLTIRTWDGISLLIGGEPLSIFKAVSICVFAVGTVFSLIVSWGWRPIWRRVPALNKWLFPDLNGEWSGELKSTWINPETGERLPPINTTITIRQGVSETCVTLRTGESRSDSDRVILERVGKTGRFRVWYSYQNGPRAQFRHRSAPHEGIAYLEYDLASPSVLEGSYYTARNTTGDIKVERITT